MVNFYSGKFIFNFFCSAALLGICLESYGKYRISLKDANKAIKLFTEALEISRKVFGTKHQQVSVVIVIYQYSVILVIPLAVLNVSIPVSKSMNGYLASSGTNDNDLKIENVLYM